MSKDEVKFTEMKFGDKEDYDLLANFEDKYIEGTADRIVRVLQGLDKSMGGYKVSRLEHSLQTASRALREKASEEMVVAALLHDIGDEIAPLNHSELAAAVLKPFVSEKTRWIVEQHGLFQAYYYNHHYGKDRNLRDKFIGHDFFQDTIDFCESGTSLHLIQIMILFHLKNSYQWFKGYLIERLIEIYNYFFNL